ncbi:transmembrane sensor [Pedobacter sp. CG_S7]|uniref:FecR family protein n=1 Tax=Pedobacter sp. CG_S7 TaxID=3143930 RepID=UPI0033975272
MIQEPADKWHIKKLALKWQEGTISEEEKILFNQWYHSYDDPSLKGITTENAGQLKNRLYKNITEREQIYPERSGFRKYQIYISSAAALILVLSLITYFYFNKNGVGGKEQSMFYAENILPGENKAVLTLADGSAFILDQTSSGVIGNQGGVSIIKSKDGKVSYEVSQNKSHTVSAIFYNKIATPRGGQYQVNLSDGTKVWLNAASTLKFPTTFDNGKRVVELTGEAYFEVNPISQKGNRYAKTPFLVKTRNQTVEVLGTHFNVNAYDDEPDTKTTLLEGSVKVMQLASPVFTFLKPGQQSVTNHGVTVFDVNALQAVEWQKGYFSFDNENVESMMRKISRWYDVEVEYRGNIRNRKFGGRISKFENISQVLHVMEKTQVIHFYIEGRKIIVMP